MMPTRILLTLLFCSLLHAGPARSQSSVEAQPAEPRFALTEDGHVRDASTGLLWAAQDNGGDIDWSGAQEHCRSLGGGFSLPTASELITLFNTGPVDNQPCLGLVTCLVTPMIRLSGLAPWTMEGHGHDEAWYVYFADGQAYTFKTSDRPGKRALCVRRP